MRTVMTLSVLFIAAAGATPGFANYFHNPHMGLNLSIGSAPSPTPRDIRENRMPQLFRAAPPATAASAKTVTADAKLPRQAAAK